MNLEYTYEIISVDATAQCMDVKYSSEGREPILVGVRLPFEGEPLELVVDEFSPMAYWLALEAPKVAPKVGATGVISPTPVAQEVVVDAAPEDPLFVLVAENI